MGARVPGVSGWLCGQLHGQQSAPGWESDVRDPAAAVSGVRLRESDKVVLSSKVQRCVAQREDKTSSVF